jgi:hypothetical protein
MFRTSLVYLQDAQTLRHSCLQPLYTQTQMSATALYSDTAVCYCFILRHSCLQLLYTQTQMSATALYSDTVVCNCFILRHSCLQPLYTQTQLSATALYSDTAVCNCFILRHRCLQLLYTQTQLSATQILALRFSNTNANTRIISATISFRWVTYFQFQTETLNVFSVLATLVLR